MGPLRTRQGYMALNKEGLVTDNAGVHGAGTEESKAAAKVVDLN